MWHTPNHPQVASSVSKETVTLGDFLMIFFPSPESSEMINSYVTSLAVNQWFATICQLTSERYLINKKIISCSCYGWVWETDSLWWSNEYKIALIWYEQVSNISNASEINFSWKIEFQGLDWLKTHINSYQGHSQFKNKSYNQGGGIPNQYIYFPYIFVHENTNYGPSMPRKWTNISFGKLQ